MKMKQLTVALTFIWVSIFGGATVASAAHKPPISIRITLDKWEVKAGTSIHGVAILTNSAPQSVLVESCVIDGWLFIGVTNSNIPYNPAVATVGCPPSVRLKPGANRFRITVMTTYQECGSSTTPRCPKVGMPALPRGTYHVAVETLGLSLPTLTFAHLRVTLT